eukprot:TRINITY_DN8924_c0_g1_i1.p1 TRINITY_DN8924_c0_g1~~TRINITY_DN8924_c0_g1_i1.p1  ORF type:complete len:466 (+),score=40.01 TRINITY_DN8924_c0_g1_i1:96-1493(+)
MARKDDWIDQVQQATVAATNLPYKRVLMELLPRLRPFFQCLGEFQFSKAVQVLKQKHSLSKLQYFSELVAPLLQLTECEKIYYSLSYLEYSWLRKDSLNNLYSQIPAGLKYMITLMKRCKTFTELQEDINSACTLLQEVSMLIQARLSLISLYRSLDGIDKPADFHELKNVVVNLWNEFKNCLTHPDLADVKENLLSEIDILQRLFGTQLCLEAYQYKDAMLSLTLTRHRLQRWVERRDSSEEWKQNCPAIVTWFASFCGALLSKATLYFFDFIREKATENKENLSSQLARLPINYAAAIEAFANKTNAQHICLIYEADGLDYPIREVDEATGNLLAYRCPDPLSDSPFEPPQGLRSFPAIFSHPLDQPAPVHEHWPNIISLIIDRAKILNRYAEPVHFSEASNKGVITYFLNRVEPRVILLLIYREVKKKNDPMVLEFVKVISDRLRLLSMFRHLKPNSMMKLL